MKEEEEDDVISLHSENSKPDTTAAGVRKSERRKTLIVLPEYRRSLTRSMKHQQQKHKNIFHHDNE